MGWSIGFDENWMRDVGYGVPAYCDHPDCSAEIDRGLGYVCGGEPYGGEYGCGLFFCEEHLFPGFIEEEEPAGYVCNRCLEGKEPFEPKPDHPDWIRWKLTDPSWGGWRANNPNKVASMQASLADTGDTEEIA